ncbi:MAG: nitrous oxide-stimulated promoter family protein [Dehalobacterium sp.]
MKRVMPLSSETRKIEQEKKVIEVMIRLFCTKNHHTKKNLCVDCQKLLDYAHQRLDRCPFGNQKSTCTKCTVHCYQKEMREKVRCVMRFSGPRMVYCHPLMALRHAFNR